MPVPTSMTESRAGDGGSDADDSIPRGGPIFVPNMVSLLTRVSTFEDSVIQELQNLQTDLNTDSVETFDDEISVDELKIVTEEDLAIKAIEEVFKDDGSLKGSSLQNCRTITNKSKGINGKGQDVDDQENCAEQDNIAKDMKRNRINEESNNFEDGENCAENLKTAKKRKTMKGKNHKFGEDRNFDAKVEPFLKIKQKQEEEKAAARLHSFNGGLQKTNECQTKSLDEIERMISLRSIDGVTKVNKSNFHGDHVPVIYPEVVLCIEVYSNKHQARTKTQEFLVLGCQFLSELKDKIYCLTDKVMQKAEQHDPSGYFLIEDVFCNDMRDDKATDYSEPILDWLRNSKDEAVEKWEAILSGQLQKKQKALLGNGISSKLPCFRAVEMQKMRFCDLSFRVGAGYVYCHQGACKHIIVVRDMRLIHPKDVQNRRIYPIVTFQFKERLQKCSVCKICIAEKVTVDDKWAAENPCYFCRNCYYMLHYADGSLLYEEFSVYDYLHE